MRIQGERYAPEHIGSDKEGVAAALRVFLHLVDHTRALMLSEACFLQLCCLYMHEFLVEVYKLDDTDQLSRTTHVGRRAHHHVLGGLHELFELRRVELGVIGLNRLDDFQEFVQERVQLLVLFFLVGEVHLSAQDWEDSCFLKPEGADA